MARSVDPGALCLKAIDTEAAGAPPPADVVIEARGLCRVLGGWAAPRKVLQGVALSIRHGEFVALTGSSGSGKSTLLYLLGALDRPTAGEIWFEGVELSQLDDNQRAALRRERLGFVFQFHFLLPELTAAENVMVPMLRLGRLRRTDCEDRAHALLAQLDLGDLRNRKPGELSGGQQQRVAVARAIANDPTLVLADEPTGNLDSANAQRVLEALEGLVRGQGRSVLMVTHAPELARRADRQVRVKDGRVVPEAVEP